MGQPVIAPASRFDLLDFFHSNLLCFIHATETYGGNTDVNDFILFGAGLGNGLVTLLFLFAPLADLAASILRPGPCQNPLGGWYVPGGPQRILRPMGRYTSFQGIQEYP